MRATAAVLSNECGNALKRHHLQAHDERVMRLRGRCCRCAYRDGARSLCDSSLLGVHDVHDCKVRPPRCTALTAPRSLMPLTDAAFEHLREAHFDSPLLTQLCAVAIALAAKSARRLSLCKRKKANAALASTQWLVATFSDRLFNLTPHERTHRDAAAPPS